jgi:hypothetical protein
VLVVVFVLGRIVVFEHEHEDDEDDDEDERGARFSQIACARGARKVGRLTSKRCRRSGLASVKIW